MNNSFDGWWDGSRSHSNSPSRQLLEGSFIDHKNSSGWSQGFMLHITQPALDRKRMTQDFLLVREVIFLLNDIEKERWNMCKAKVEQVLPSKNFENKIQNFRLENQQSFGFSHMLLKYCCNVYAVVVYWALIPDSGNVKEVWNVGWRTSAGGGGQTHSVNNPIGHHNVGLCSFILNLIICMYSGASLTL